MTLQTAISRNPDFVHRNVGGEQLLVPVRRAGADLSCIYLLDVVGSVIWETLEQPRTGEQLVDAVTAEFDVDRETASADLLQFLDELRGVDAILAEDAR